MGRLDGKVALVTGAARGIGRAIAETFAAEGALVAAADVIPLEGDSRTSLFRHLDVTDESAWIEVVQSVHDTLGAINILVNNAGVTGPDPIHTLTLAEWNRIIGVDQTGVFLGIKSTIPSMRVANGGSIINISSICGAAAVPGIAAYHAAKGAVLTITKNTAVTYSQEGIRANAILPGWIKTPMTAGQDDATNAVFTDATPIPRPGNPEDIAWGAVYLASDESSFVTGVELPIDGGYLAR